jgi:GGDEF domain-containing protein
MESKETSNLPSTDVKKMSFFDYLKRAINSKKEIKKADKIVEKLSKIKEYDVLSMSAFNHIVENKLKEDKTGLVIMSDINNLYEANKFASKKVVNEEIKTMINQIKEKISEKNITDFEIGKLGDEIYTYLPKQTEDVGNKLVEEFGDIKINLLSLSSGMSSNLEKGLEFAKKEAEDGMYQEKLEYKNNLLMNFCKGDPDKVVKYCIKKELIKARIDLKELRDKSQFMDFVNIYDRVVRNLSIQDILKENEKLDVVHEKGKEEVIQEENKNKKLEQKYITEANIKLGNVPEDIKNKYVLAQFLSRSPVDGTVTSEYFENFEKENLKNKKNIEVLGLDISGLKFVNDKYGHDEGDKEIEKVLQNLNKTLNELNIKAYSDIVVKGAGNAIVVLPKIGDEKKQNLINKIASIDSKLNVTCEITSSDNIEKDLKEQNGVKIFEQLRNVTENNLNDRSFERKIKDEKSVERLVGQIYNNIFSNSIIKCTVDNNFKTKNEIINQINKSFFQEVKEASKDSNIVFLDDIKKVKEAKIEKRLEESSRLKNETKKQEEIQ